jgi:hypothetical protein
MTKLDDKLPDDDQLFRDAILVLRDFTPHEWTPWEVNWLGSQLRRRRTYKLSNKERKILTQLLRVAKQAGSDAVLLQNKVRELRQLRGLTARDAALYVLRDLSPHDWSDWELDWLDSQILRRPMGYERSEKEEAILTQLIDCSQGHTSHAGKSICHWVAVAAQFRFDLSESEADFVQDLHVRRLDLLRKRQFRLLLRILEQQGLLDEAA